MQNNKEQLEEVLDKVLLVWKQDFPKDDGDDGLDMDGYFERLGKAKIEATKAIEQLIREAEIRGLEFADSNVYHGEGWESVHDRIEQLKAGEK